MLAAMARNAVIAPLLVYTMSDAAKRAAIDAIDDFLLDGMRHRIAATLPLDAIAEAHERQERGGVSGKILLAP
jgi:NADPH:quinone reductase-like Zn-dependent oxidoreductase